MPKKGIEDLRDQVDLALRSRVTLIVLVTPEEERALQLVREVYERWNPPRQCVSWDIVDGYSTVVGTGFSAPARDPLTGLDEMQKTDEQAVIVLKDFHEFWNNPAVKRKIRNYAQKFRYTRLQGTEPQDY